MDISILNSSLTKHKRI
jgi:hypothetical protein